MRTRRHSFRALLAVAAMWVAADAAAEAPRVSGVRIGNHAGITRVVFSVSGPVKYRAFELGPPYRVVLDMPAVAWGVSRDMRFGPEDRVAALRFGAFGPDINRVVMDLRRPMRIQKAFFMRPNDRTRSWRIVIDLEPVSADTFERMLRRRRAGRRTRQEGESAPRGQGTRRSADRPLIFIDPGHGGIDPGAISRVGIREKDVVLRFARRLRTELRTDGRYRVAFTRTRDFYVALRERFERAREASAALFISIHADAHPKHDTGGLTVYTLSAKPSDRAAAALAKRENASDGIAGIDLSRHSAGVTGILRDLVTRETGRRSRAFARAIVRRMRGITVLAPRPLRSARFAVLRAPDVPSVLIELGFLTNRRDTRRLVNDRHMRRVATALAAAINDYFKRPPAKVGQRR